MVIFHGKGHCITTKIHGPGKKQGPRAAAEQRNAGRQCNYTLNRKTRHRSAQGKEKAQAGNLCFSVNKELHVNRKERINRNLQEVKADLSK